MKLLALALFAIFAVAAAAVAVLRYEADKTRHAHHELVDIQLNVMELAALDAQALSSPGAARDRLRRWAVLSADNDARFSVLVPLVRDEAPSHADQLRRLMRPLRTYEVAIRAELGALVVGEVASARRIHGSHTDSLFRRLERGFEATAASLERLAARRDRDANAGSIVAVIAVLALGGWLILWNSHARHAAALRTTEERLRALVENASDALVVVDERGSIRDMAGSAESILGEDWRSLRGTGIVALVHPDDRPLLASLLADSARDARKSRTAELRMGCCADRHAHVEIVAKNLLAIAHIRGIVLTIRNISARKELENQLRHRAFYDDLTNLPNRALFYDRVEHALDAQSRSEGFTAILLADLDDFKDLNDTLGHAGGDEVLVEVGRRLTASTRSADTAARLGGDEFAVLLEGIGGPGEAVEVGDRFLRALEDPVIVQGQAVDVHPSIGITVSRHKGASVELLLRNADLAMYAAKRKGKSRCELFDDKLEAAVREAGVNGGAPRADGGQWTLHAAEQRDEVLSVLEQAGAIETVFQPIVDIRTGQVAGYEALSRFHTGQQRPPNVWFELAHRCGLGAQLEAVALRRALEWAADVPSGAYLSVNLSPSALTSEVVQDALPEDLHDLVIEITENELVTGREALQGVLAQMRERGGRLACDDAGAGYAGLRQLMRLRPEMIKLDRALTEGVHADLAKRALVESMVRYARNIGASVCSEGIELLEELATLADLDVTYGQGYGLARPAPPWPAISGEAMAVCTASLRAVIGHQELRRERIDSGDHRLEHISRRLFESTRPSDFQEVMALVGAELRADEIICQTLDARNAQLRIVATYGWQSPGETQPLCELPATHHVIETGQALQVLISDPDADTAELDRMVANGVRSLLKIPITVRGHTVGVLEAWSHQERPWTRTDMHRARIISYQLGAVFQALDPHNAAVPQEHMRMLSLSAIGIEAVRRRDGAPAPPQKEVAETWPMLR